MILGNNEERDAVKRAARKWGTLFVLGYSGNVEY
jgi:hypothetical protein